MPLYFFDVLEIDGRVTEDHYGVELASEEEAIRQANRTLAEMAREEMNRETDFEIRIRTKDAGGKEIACRRAKVSKGGFQD